MLIHNTFQGNIRPRNTNYHPGQGLTFPNEISVLIVSREAHMGDLTLVFVSHPRAGTGLPQTENAFVCHASKKHVQQEDKFFSQHVEKTLAS